MLSGTADSRSTATLQTSSGGQVGCLVGCLASWGWCDPHTNGMFISDVAIRHVKLIDCRPDKAVTRPSSAGIFYGPGVDVSATSRRPPVPMSANHQPPAARTHRHLNQLRHHLHRYHLLHHHHIHTRKSISLTLSLTHTQTNTYHVGPTNIHTRTHMSTDAYESA